MLCLAVLHTGFVLVFLKASCNKQHDSIYYVNGLLATRYCLTMLWLAVLRYTVWDLHRFVLVAQHFWGWMQAEALHQCSVYGKTFKLIILVSCCLILLLSYLSTPAISYCACLLR